MTPLFIPLKREFYEAFERGDKTEEYRLYGPRWNEKTCVVGRPVVLSLGYGKQHRMTGVISYFSVQRGSNMQGFQRIALRHVYGTTDLDVACIAITIDKEA